MTESSRVSKRGRPNNGDSNRPIHIKVFDCLYKRARGSTIDELYEEDIRIDHGQYKNFRATKIDLSTACRELIANGYLSSQRVNYAITFSAVRGTHPSGRIIVEDVIVEEAPENEVVAELPKVIEADEDDIIMAAEHVQPSAPSEEQESAVAMELSPTSTGDIVVTDLSKDSDPITDVSVETGTSKMVLQHQAKLYSFFQQSVSAAKPVAPMKMRGQNVDSKDELCEKAHEIESSILTDFARQRVNTNINPLKKPPKKASTFPMIRTQNDRIAMVQEHDESNNLYSASFLKASAKGIICNACNTIYTDMTYVFSHLNKLEKAKGHVMSPAHLDNVRKRIETRSRQAVILETLKGCYGAEDVKLFRMDLVKNME